MDILKETERGLTDNQVEEVLTDDPFESGDTVLIVCTEILENSEEEDNKTEEANDLHAFSWYDLFNDAYGSWGRDESLKAPLMDITETTEAIPVKREIDDGGIEKTEQDVSFNLDDNTEIGPNEEAFQDTDKDLTFETFYKAFLDVQDFSINGIEETQVDANEGTSGVQTIENEDIFNELSDNDGNNTGCVDQPTRRTPTKKAKVECRRSARLSSKVLLDLGSVVKIEEEDGIKIVLRRRSSRLAEGWKGPEEADRAWKKPKK